MTPGFAASCDPDWLLHYVEVRFGRDAEGRLNPQLGLDEIAPSFVLARSSQGNIWRFAADLPAQQIGDLARLAGREPAIPPATSDLPPPERLEPLCAVLRQVGRCESAERRAPAAAPSRQKSSI